MNSTIFWNVTSFSLVKVYGHFTGMYSLKIQDSSVNQAASWVICLLDWLFNFEYGGCTFCKMWLSIRLHSIISHDQLKVNWHFGETFRLHLQGRKISQAKDQHESRWQAELFLQNICWLSVDYRALYPEESTLHNHCCENLKSSLTAFYFQHSFCIHMLVGNSSILS
jgi:hypothetical protein